MDVDGDVPPLALIEAHDAEGGARGVADLDQFIYWPQFEAKNVARLNVGIFRCRLEGQIISANPAFMRIYGINPAVDPQTLLLTGLTRDGVYRVQGGEITGAVNNFRYNESPIDLLNRFSAATETVPSFSREWGDDYFSRTATPGLRVPDFNMSSVSQAN